MSIRVGITGVAGRMGRMLVEAVHQSGQGQVTGAIERSGSEFIGRDIFSLVNVDHAPLAIVDTLEAAIDNIDVLIDFTAPAATLDNMALCVERKKPIVVGTTGFTQEQNRHFDRNASDLAICKSANYSTGVTLCLKLLETAASIMGSEADIEIVEAHHRHKVDAPSGTALAMGEAIADTLDRNLSDCAVYGREGQTGARDSNTIGFATVRGGDVVGDHTVMFLCDGERVEVTHKASSRFAFARGAVKAACWLVDRPNGLYDMKDVLAL